MARRNRYRAGADMAHQDTETILREIQSRAHRDPIERHPPKTLRELEREAAALSALVELVIILLAVGTAAWLAWVVLG